MPDVFLSYAGGDEAMAKRLTAELSAKGLSVFSDFELLSGDYSNQIKRALASSDAVVVLLSQHSPRSEWLKEEVRTALESRQRIIPVLLDEAATENWVWPLISDRYAIRLDSNTTIDRVVAEVVRAVRPESLMVNKERITPFELDERSRRKVMIVALLSALAGAIVSWLITR